MSLDVYLNQKHECNCKYCEVEDGVAKVYRSNITHNLRKMAMKAGIYYALWRPEEINCNYAKDIIPYLKKGLKYLKSAPEKYKKYDSPNGWGLYIHFVPFVEKYLEACEKFPDCEIEISR